MEIVKTHDEIIVEFKNISERLEKAQDQLTKMKNENWSAGMIEDMRMCVQRLAAKKEVFMWLVY